MSLTDKENTIRTWGRFPQLYEWLEKQEVSLRYAGLSSASEDFSSHFGRLYEIVIRYLSATDDYVPSAPVDLNSSNTDKSHCDEDRSRKLNSEIMELAEGLATVGHHLKNLSDEIISRKNLAVLAYVEKEK